MPIHRRDFMKLLGVSLAPLLLSRCRPVLTPQPTCYTAVAVTPSLPPTGKSSAARERLRLYWLRFGELAEKSQTDTDDKFGEALVAGHRAALAELVASGEITAPVAELVQEAYAAAVYHVWRSNIPATCYDMNWTYSPDSASMLMEQVKVLNQVAEQGAINPDTLAKAQAALEHDMAFYALTEEEVQALYDRLLKESGETGQPVPSFEALSLELTPEAQEATQFIIDLLTSK